MKRAKTKIITTLLAVSMAFSLTACGDKPCEHTYDNACDTICNICSEERTITHTPNADDGSCLTEITCSVCGTVTTEGKTAHDFSEIAYTWADDYSTCVATGICVYCGEMTETVSTVNENGVTTATFTNTLFEKQSIVNAANMDTTALSTALTSLLSQGETEIAISLPKAASTDMFNAITQALSTDTVENGSINLTLSGCESISEAAFEYCKKLVSVTIGNGVTSIGISAFYYCTSLTSVTIGNSVTSIGVGVFYECTSFTSITIPDSVTSIGDYAFGGCTSLGNVYYKGTATDWKSISIGAIGNEDLTDATRYYYVENENDVPTDGGNYWHYDENGNIVVWNTSEE